MADLLNQIWTWIASWDFMAILYGIVSSIIFAIILGWFGVYKKLKHNIKLRKGIKAYKSKIKGECSSLIVIGRRSGFTIDDVYVSLDIALSDLSNKKIENKKYPRGSYVLVGGPGAGKSTTVKKKVLHNITNHVPFFVRLREYSGYSSIEDFIVHKLTSCGIPEPKSFLNTELSRMECLCVLDGLDEVRPQHRSKVCEDINLFYSKYFHDNRNELIVSCRKEAYRDIPLDINEIWEVRPLTDEQIKRFASKWPPGYPGEKSKDTFWRDLCAAEKILELARSPLLLVGGLMQYTESNLGIPDERFEYLARVSSWLVSDWATAQGHPPDPDRPVYDRLLARLAFYMHSHELSELAINDANNQMDSWLPTFGYSSDKGESLLNSIFEKTGILVREGKNNIVFSQFSLQEYFASLEIINSKGIGGITELKPINWWRESILLTVAQQREPTKVLKKLFSEEPLLAAAAVAECPTPPIDMQVKAIEFCLNEIDNNKQETQSAAVNLLRKVKSAQERLFCDELENRLISNKDIHSLVGLTLALAGTEATTNILASHPEVWDSCLSEAGYLSTSFENLLVEWIKNGNNEQSDRASELIIGRLSKDRMNQLLRALPVLPPERSNKLATLLLLSTAENYSGHHPFELVDREVIDITSGCVPYIKDKNIFLEEYYNKYQANIRDEGSIITTAVCIEGEKNRNNPERLKNIIYNSITWASDKSQILMFICSCLAFLVLLHSYEGGSSWCILPVITLILYCLSYPSSFPPWVNIGFFMNTWTVPTTLMVFLLGGVSLLSVGMFAPVKDVKYIAPEILVVFPIVIILAGLIATKRRRRFYFSLDNNVNFGKKTYPLLSVAYGMILISLGGLEYYDASIVSTKLPLIIVTLVYFSWLCFVFVKLTMDWWLMKRASKKQDPERITSKIS